ncbi:MAG TPA: acyltransferase [Phycisphaerae bacterium]|nr:acyltransferase [Phycisphaerae bacterium]
MSVAHATRSVPPGRPRLHALDAVRGGAVLAVVLAHCAVAYSLLARQAVAWPYDPFARDTLSEALLCLIRPLPIPLFFFISGFYAEAFLRRRGPRAFVRSRLRRIGLPLLLAMLTVFPLVCLVWAWGLLDLDVGLAHWIRRSHVRKLIQAEVLGPAHLWFLRDLLLISLLYVPAAWLGRRLTVRGGATWTAVQAIGGKACHGRIQEHLPERLPAWVWLCPIATGLLIWMRPQTITAFQNTFWPNGMEFLYNAMFFVAGAFWHRHDPQLTRTSRCPLPWLVFSLATFLAFWAVLYVHWANPDDPASRMGLALLGCLYVWAGLWTVLGLAAASPAARSHRARRMAESSYWVYLVHLPVVGALQILLRPVPLAGAAKTFIVCCAAVALCLVGYRFLARPTWVGRLLTARRKRPTESLVVAGSQARLASHEVQS